MASADGTSDCNSNSLESIGFSQLFRGIAELPVVVKLLEIQAQEIKEMKRELAELARCSQGVKDTGWIDAKGAAAHLNMSTNTFDKYRYQTTPRIRGYKVGGKILYQRADLDRFVKLFEIRSNGQC